MALAGRPHIITVAIHKGGAGKTSTTLGLAGAWARQGLRVAVVDFDPQSNLTEGLIEDRDRIRGTVHDWLWEGAPTEEVMIPSDISNHLWVIPGDPDVSRWEDLLLRVPRDVIIRRSHTLLMDLLPRDFDIVILDTPPTLGVATQCALAVADSVLIPVKPERFCVAGLADLTHTIDWVIQHVNPELRIAGVVLNQVTKRTIEQDHWMSRIRQIFPRHVLDVVVPNRIAVPESQTRRKPIEFYPDAPEDLREIYRELSRTLSVRLEISAAPSEQEIPL